MELETEATVLHIESTPADLEGYIRESLRHTGCRFSAALRDEITAALLRHADGCFLLTKIHLEHVLDHVTTSEIRRTLGGLPQNVDLSYESTLSRIKSKSPQIQDVTYKTVSSILHSTRALTFSEVLEIISVQIWSPRRDPGMTPEPEFLLECCSGLVCVESGTLHLAHDTAYHYLKTCPCIPDSSYLAKVCLTYLLLEDLESAADLDQLPLLEYAARYWLVHLKGKEEQDPEILDRLRLLFTDRQRFGLIQECCCINFIWGRYQYSFDTSPLHLAARAGLSQVIVLLLHGTWGEETCLPKVDSYGRTPLHEACTQKDPLIVERLLEWDRTLIDEQDCDGLTALHYAAEEGNVELLNLLFNYGADPNIKDNRGWDALSIALAAREVPTARALLDRLFSVGSGSVSRKWDGPVGGWYCDGYTLLHQAANLGYLPAVKRLLEAGADPKAETRLGTTPLAFASRNGHDEVVTILLKATNNMVNPNALGNTPLHRACQWGQESTVRALIEADGAQVNAKTWIGFTPLHWASAGGHADIVKLLCKSTAPDFNPSVPSPIQLAAWGGHEEAVTTLLEHDDTGLPTLNFDSVKAIVRQFNSLTKGFGQTHPLPKHFTGGIELCHYYGVTQMKLGRLKMASAWLDLAIMIDPRNTAIDTRTVQEITCSNKACDVCGVCPISGPYFTCSSCVRPCYDLCGECHGRPFKASHPHNGFIRVPSSSATLPTLEELLQTLKVAMELELPPTVFSQV